MMDSLLKRIENNRKAHTRWLAMILCLSMIVSLGTFAGFHKTAVAKTYTKEVLDCPYAQEGASPVAHVHNDDCYDGDTLVCTLPEREAHTHTEECFAEQRRLTCVLEENPGHQHSDACYAAREEITCGLEENPGHVHNGTCFNDSGVLICTMAEGDGAHTHTADCFTTVYDLVCDIPAGEGAHTHTDECYTTERVQVCGQEELPVHVHGPECIRTVEWNEGEDEPVVTDEPAESTVPEMPVSDPNADLETVEDWNREFENLELSGNWARDLILVAATQQGRGESPNNFEAFLNDAGDAWVRYGYTRYGAWYGVPYANEWSAMFVSFCLRYAGIPAENVPNNPTAAFMAESFQKGELFAGRDYVPAVGDLIFFDTVVDDDITNIDHMGIVYHVDAEDGTINTVEGDRTNAVAPFGYHLDDEQIVGYGILPQNPNYVPTEEENTDDELDGLIVMTTDEEEEPEETPAAEDVTAPAAPMPAQSWERTAGGIKVSVEAPEGAFPENTSIAVTPVNGNRLKDTVSDAVSGEVLEVQAVDITFFDAEGNEIEPAIPIRVTMTPAATQHAEEKTSVVHVDIAEQTAELIEQAAGTELDNSEVVFDADAFTIYAIVYTVDTYFRSCTGETFRVTMDFDENAGIPQNAELVVEEILEESADYSNLLSQTENTLDGNKQISFVRFFDISIMADGEEVQPLAPVSMKIQLADLPEETTEADAQVIHFGDQPEVLTTEAAGANVSFEANGFSVYAVVYTVDFEYEVDGKTYQFSLPGGEKIALSDLIEVLGIIGDTNNGEKAAFNSVDSFLKEVANVEFSDESLVKVTPVEGDWELESLQPFDTDECLTITMKNGDVITVKVTDDSTEFHNLNGSATSITADLKSGTDINYDTNSQMFTASVTATFNIPTDTIKSEKNYYLELDDDIVIPESALNIKRRSIDQNEKKESFEYWVEKDSSGKYVLKISYLDDYLDEVEVIGKNTINIDLLVKELEEEGTDHKKFNFTNDLPIVVNNKEIHYPDNDNGSSNISVEKTYSSMGTGTKDGKTVSYIDYTVTVSSTKGTGENITLTDTMSSLNAQYNWWQNRELSVTDVEVLNVAATGEGTSTDYTFTKGENNDSFTMELFKINAAGSYTITYRYYLDKDLTEDLEDGDTRLVASGSNRAVAETSKIHDSDDAGFTYTKTNQPVEVGKKGTYDESTKKITWTITLKITKGEHDLYDEAFANASNLTITREEGDDFTTSQDGNTIHFNNPGTYTITYTTDASTQYMYDAYKVNNQALVDDGQYKSDDVGVDVPVDGTGVIEKQLVESELVSSGSGTETYNTTWFINFTLPDVLPAGTVLRDTLTYSKKGDIDHKFTEEQKNELISNLEDIFGNNVFDVELNDIDSGHELVLTLKNDWTNTTGKNSVSLTYTTTSVVDLDAVNRGLSTQTNADKFTNRFSIDDVSASADFSYRKEVNKIDPAYRDGTKVTSHNITRENNGLKWEIVLNLSDDYNDMIITDTLPSGLTVTKVEIGGEYNLDTYSNYSESGNTRTFTYDGGNRYIANNVTSITAEKSDTGTNLVVSLHVDETHPRSSYFEEGDQVHMIVYADVDENEFAAVSDLTKSYTNTVSVTGDGKPLGDDDQTQKTTLESSALSKSEVELTKDEWKNYHYLSYQVPINLDGHAMLPEDAEDNTYSVDDVVSFNKLSPDGKEINFMLVPGSVKLQTKSGNDWVDVDNSVAWSYQYIESKDGDIRYKTISVSGLPDNTVLRLIYTYEVDLSDTEGGHAYNLGDITNSATVHGETDRTITIHTHKSWEQFSSDASTESSYTLTLSKVDLSDYNKLLPGTKFVLEKYQDGKWIVLDAISQEDQYLSTESNTANFGNGATLSNPSQSTYQIYVTSSSTGSKYGTLKMYMPTNDSSYSGSYFEPGICYRVREYEAPDGGYVVSADPEQQPAGYFWFSKDHNGTEFTGTVEWPPNKRIQDLADDLSTESDTFYITNAKQPSLKITKKVIGDAELTEEQLASLTFTVYNSDGEEVGRLTYKDILKNKNVISNDKIINGQTYTVKETGIDAQGVTWTATYTVNTDDVQTATGTETVSSSTQIDVGEVEIVNNVGTVAITNKYDSVKTSIKTTKEWVDYEGQTVTNPSSKTIQFQVYQMKEGETEGVLYIVNGAEEAETHTISFDETTKSWDTTTVNELPKYYYDETGNLKEYSYYVVETAPTAHLTTTYKLGDNGEYGEASSAATANDSSTIVIKNVEEEPPHFEVTKNWVDSDGVTDYTAKTSKNKVYFKVFVNWDWSVYNPVDAGVMEEDSSVYNTEKKYFIIDKVDNGSGSYSWETIDVKFPHDFKPNGDTFTSFWIQEVDENGNAVNDVKVTYTVDDVTETHPIVVAAGEGNLGAETITNREKDKLTVKKTWIDGQDHSSSPDKIQFHLYRRQIGTTDWQTYKEWQELKPGEGWEKNYSGLEEGYEYKVEEQNPSSDYTVTYSTDGDNWAKSGDIITVTNTKKVSETSVAVQKIWDVKHDTLKSDVAVKLMQAQGIPQGNTVSARVGIKYEVTEWDGKIKEGTNYSDLVSKIVGNGNVTVTLNRYGGVNVGEVLIDGIPIPKSNYSVDDVDSNRSITITGINSSVNIEIIHDQVYSYDTAKYTSTISISGEPASSIVPEGDPTEYDSYTLKASENWYHEWPDLPATNTVSGTTYVYSYYVVEDPVPDGVSVSYSTDNGDTWKDSLTANDAVSGGKTYQIKNTEEEPQSGSVKVTKVFSGVSSLPSSFIITATYDDGIQNRSIELTTSTPGVTGTGTADDPYVWILDNIPVGTEVTFTESGATVDGAALTIIANGTAVEAGRETATAKATSAKVETGGDYPTATFVNEYEQSTDFEFSKIWKDIGNQPTAWPTGATITVTLNAYTDDISKKEIDDVTVELSANGSAAGVTPVWTAMTSAEGTVTTFKVEGLQKYKDGKELHYYVIETQVDGYKAPSYATSEGKGLVFTGSDVPKATDGQQIINTPEGGYELPSTGGIGTTLFTVLGGLMTATAGAILTMKSYRRRKENA